MKSVTIICVLKCGGPYGVKDVRRLRDNLAEHITLPYNFLCLSDTHIPDIDCVPLIGNYDGWWSKVEMFRNVVYTERILYFDLDTVITGNIDEMLLVGAPFIGLHPFNPINALNEKYFASGILGWKNNSMFSFLFDDFVYKIHSKKFKGDQDYLSHVFYQKGFVAQYWQDLVPGIYSYKRHYIKGIGHNDCRVLCFHGRPRPADVDIVKIKEVCVLKEL